MHAFSSLIVFPTYDSHRDMFLEHTQGHRASLAKIWNSLNRFRIVEERIATNQKIILQPLGYTTTFLDSLNSLFSNHIKVFQNHMKPSSIQTSIYEDEEMLAHVQRSGKHDSNHVSSSLVTHNWHQQRLYYINLQSNSTLDYPKKVFG